LNPLVSGPLMHGWQEDFIAFFYQLRMDSPLAITL
jgi:hypothetical protein